MNDKGCSRRINGFSKLSKIKKIQWIAENFFRDPDGVVRELISYWHRNDKQQEILDGFSENTISNFLLPYGVAPNFLIDGKYYCVPMVIEESSVVAAAASAAKYWADRGGIQTKVLGTIKSGQIHFLWHGDTKELQACSGDLKKYLIHSTKLMTESMRNRGGGILDIELRQIHDLDHCFQLFVSFETKDSMGANFINSVLERMAADLDGFFESRGLALPEVLMSILSNYTPSCLVSAEVMCPVSDLGSFDRGKITAPEFARRFKTAIDIATADPYRAVTHNKGIFNGVDSVVLATANDFRAVEAGAHAYACRDGQYRSLSWCKMDGENFRFGLEIPLAIGTVGGLTKLHPMAQKSLELLGNPSAHRLMSIIAATGLAQNFSAVRSLVTSGIQKGHMRMHLMNIIRQLEIPERYHQNVMVHFADRIVSFQAVKSFYQQLSAK